MIIKNNYIKIVIKDEQVTINDILFKCDSFYELYNKILDEIEQIKKEELIFFGDYNNISKTTELILLCLSNYYEKIFSIDYNKYMDITFSYNFSIFSNKWIIPKILDVLDDVLECQFIALGDSDDFIVCDVSDEEKYKKFKKKYGYYLRRGNRDFHIEKESIKRALEYWNIYCIRRHNRDFNELKINTYEKIYSNKGFNAITIYCKDDVVLKTIYFLNNNILYFCILGWNEKYKAYSPAIYCYAKGIEYCNNSKYYFSFCYGKQKYKYNLLKYFGNYYDK